MIINSLAFLIVAAAGPTSDVARSDSTVGTPPRRAHHALVYSEERQQVLLTGGSTPGADGSCCVFFNDTWAFDGKMWIPLGESGEKMSGMRLFVDSERRVRSVGGFDGRPMGVLRTLTGSAWRSDEQMPALAASEPGAAYDTRRKRLVFFGGSAGRETLPAETWEHDGASWQRRDVSNPPPRQSHMLAYDAKRGRVVLFGGSGSAPAGQRPPALADLWEFDGRQWVARDADAGPPARHSAGITYDTRRGRTIIFGGIGESGVLGDTWAWDGERWSKLAESGPPPRAMGYLAYDSRRDRVVLFGGRLGWPNDAGDTWEFDGATWKLIQR